MTFSLSDHYTGRVADKTVKAVKHSRYGPLDIEFTDGTSMRFAASGTPPTIFMSETPPVLLIARVIRERSR